MIWDTPLKGRANYGRLKPVSKNNLIAHGGVAKRFNMLTPLDLERIPACVVKYDLHRVKSCTPDVKPKGLFGFFGLVKGPGSNRGPGDRKIMVRWTRDLSRVIDSLVPSILTKPETFSPRFKDQLDKDCILSTRLLFPDS
jgi:hypothetical protein